MARWPYDPSATGGVEADTAIVVHGSTPETGGGVKFEYGIDTDGRPTYTDAGTDDTPAVLILDDSRFHAREVTY